MILTATGIEELDLAVISALKNKQVFGPVNTEQNLLSALANLDIDTLIISSLFESGNMHDLLKKITVLKPEIFIIFIPKSECDFKDMHTSATFKRMPSKFSADELLAAIEEK